MSDINEFFTATRNLNIQGRRACCTIRDASIHLLVWVLASIGVDLEVNFIGDDTAVLDPLSVNPGELLIAMRQLREAGLDAVAEEVRMIEILLCAHLGEYDD